MRRGLRLAAYRSPNYHTQHREPLKRRYEASGNDNHPHANAHLGTHRRAHLGFASVGTLRDADGSARSKSAMAC